MARPCFTCQSRILCTISTISFPFLADFFEQYQTGLTMRVPWLELGRIVLATFLPAVLAGRVSPI